MWLYCLATLGFSKMVPELEKILIYSATGVFLLGVVIIYLRKLKKESRQSDQKIKIAKEEGLFEPVSLHPVVDVNSCIKSGACILACPEKDILGIRKGKATVINASQCVGHGACFHACPTQAISLFIGTEKRGVELPHVSSNFESNIPGIYIAGEMGGMGLIKNAVEQGKQAIENLAKGLIPKNNFSCDVLIIGAGPAGIGATLQAKKMGLRSITLEQESLGGTVFTFPRSKIVMTTPMDLPLFGKVKLYETSKTELLNVWNEALGKNDLKVKENTKVEEIVSRDDCFVIRTEKGAEYSTQKVLIAIGRRGTPRKLDIPGEESEKVAYRLLEPERIQNKKIVVVGGGDSAIESALLLMEQNEVTLSYRRENFSRLKPKNNEKLKDAISKQRINTLLNSNLVSIEKDKVTLRLTEGNTKIKLDNDLVYIFVGGELPTEFLKKAGILITQKFGEALLTHKK